MDRNQLVNESIDYIMQHLDEDLSLESVAARFFISKYHFSRIFKAVTGESVYAFVKRCKVDQSAVDMKLNSKKTITDIACQVQKIHTDLWNAGSFFFGAYGPFQNRKRICCQNRDSGIA